MTRFVVLALSFVLSASPLPAQIDRITGKPFATRSEIIARHGVVCTSVPTGDPGRSRRFEAWRECG